MTTQEKTHMAFQLQRNRRVVTQQRLGFSGSHRAGGDARVRAKMPIMQPDTRHVPVEESGQPREVQSMRR